MWVKAIILGIIEGLEFLPVSSTGHLIIFSEMLKFNSILENVFNIVIQMGAIFSVVLYFWREIFPKDLSKPALGEFCGLWSKVVVASIPAAVTYLNLKMRLINIYLIP